MLSHFRVTFNSSGFRGLLKPLGGRIFSTVVHSVELKSCNEQSSHYRTYLDTVDRGGDQGVHEIGANYQNWHFNLEKVYFSGPSKGDFEAFGITKKVHVLFRFFCLVGNSKSPRDTVQNTPTCCNLQIIKCTVSRLKCQF